jgi:hypothetical protein
VVTQRQGILRQDAQPFTMGAQVERNR